MAECATMIQLREPVVHDVIGFMDGVAMLSECTSETMNKMQCTVGITLTQW